MGFPDAIYILSSGASGVNTTKDIGLASSKFLLRRGSCAIMQREEWLAQPPQFGGCAISTAYYGLRCNVATTLGLLRRLQTQRQAELEALEQGHLCFVGTHDAANTQSEGCRVSQPIPR